MSVRCPECMGSGRLRVIDGPQRSIPLNPFRGNPAISAKEMSVTSKVVTCHVCGGDGQVTPKRVAVLQDGHKIGTVPGAFDPMSIKSTNLMYSPRLTDFKRDGDVWIANKMLGPGDLEAVPGFVWDRS